MEMSDLISRKDAYKVLSDYYHHRTDAQHWALKEALRRVPSAEPKWIPVTERLPEKNGAYIVTHMERGERRTDWNIWVKDHWFYREDEPIAWMPLPEAFAESD